MIPRSRPGCAMAMRQVTDEAFPESWRAGVASAGRMTRNTYGQRFMLRLDEDTSQSCRASLSSWNVTGGDHSPAHRPGDTGGFSAELAPRRGRTVSDGRFSRSRRA